MFRQLKEMKQRKERKKAVKQNWRLLRGLRCSYCKEVNGGRCNKHCQLLLMQTKARELELDSEE